MNIELIDFPESREKLQPIAQATVRAVRHLMPSAPPLGERPVKLYFRPSEEPRAIVDGNDYSVMKSDHYRIHVNSGGLAYGQFVNQLSHELGHVMFDVRRTNAVLEILAVATSLQALKDVAKRWQIKPPKGHRAKEAFICRRYSTLDIERHLKEYGADAATQDFFNRRNLDAIADYARRHIADQDADPCHRLLNLAGALPLLPVMPWKDLVGIGMHTDPPPDVDPIFRTLPLKLSALPGALQDALRRIGRAVPVII